MKTASKAISEVLRVKMDNTIFLPSEELDKNFCICKIKYSINIGKELEQISNLRRVG
ncbi:hypothetical protein ACQKMI_14640 [Lysinibacillus sp. NPDC097214]|uniref:hypothetical protein n=1 Tax=Lysinibacillus sp. NPDC097214 TaxID=3390584 RepID=UPI003D053FA4